jgi:DNA relaxase NicK
LTCSYTPKAKLTRLRHYIASAQSAEEKAGNITRNWGMSGYLGYHVGGLEYGWRGDGVLVRLSGPTAQTWWRRFGRISSNCSRIDLQETFIWDEEVKTTLARHWKQMRRWASGREKAPALKLISGEHGPETLYSGKRASDIYLRAYNRLAKTKDNRFAGHLRYEVEFKNLKAKLVLDTMLRSKDHHAECASRCLGMFRNRGACLRMPFDSPTILHCPGRTSDADKRLEWLRNQVRGPVLELIALGYYDETLEALGLSELRAHDSWSNN